MLCLNIEPQGRVILTDNKSGNETVIVNRSNHYMPIGIDADVSVVIVRASVLARKLAAQHTEAT